MKRAGQQYRPMKGVLSVAVMLALTSCGGGGVDTATVAKALDAAPATVAADGSVVMSMFPAPGASQAAVDALGRAGVISISKKCGQLSSGVSTDGDLLLSAGGTPTFVVLVEVDSNDLAKAKEAGYVVATDDFMKAVKETFDCASKSL